MTRTLYLHVGMPKCASTTIQDALEANSATLAEHGKFYRKAPGDRSTGQGNVTLLEAYARDGDEAGLQKQLRFFLDRDSDVIMSSELLIGLARGRASDFVVEQARDSGFDVRLICFARRQDLWIESDFKQHVKGGSAWVAPINKLIEKRIKMKVMDYHWMLKNWHRSLDLSNMTLVPLNKGQSDIYPLERFLAFIGMDPALAEPFSDGIGRRNVSPPVGLIEPLRYLKRGLRARGVSIREETARLGRFVELASAHLEIPPRKFFLPHKQRCAILNQFADSNARLAADFYGGRPVFDELVEEDVPDLVPLGQEAAVVLGDYLAAFPSVQPQGDSPVPPRGDPATPPRNDPSGSPRSDGLIGRLRDRLGRRIR